MGEALRLVAEDGHQLDAYHATPLGMPGGGLPDWLATIAKFNPVTYSVLLVREMMTGVSEGGIPALLSIGIIAVFVLVMIGLASYVFTREVNKPF